MNPFEIDPKELKNILNPLSAVDLFRKLLWAEASRIGIGKDLINIPSCINVPDGGIDAVIEESISTNEELIPSGYVGYQIKTSNLSPKKCLEDLFNGKNTKSLLKSEVKKVFDRDGTYILILFAETSERKRQNIVNFLKKGIEDAGYKNPKIKVFILNQIISFIQKYPSIILSLKNYNGPIFTYNAWEKTQDMIKPKTFIEDEKRKKVIEEIRNKLRERNNFIARIKGLSGVGKTRLVLEALSSDDLKSKVVYFPRPEDFRMSNLLNRITYENDLEAIIVVDDCYVRDHDDLLNCLKNRGDGIALITISDDMVKATNQTPIYHIDTLSKESMEQLIRNEMPGIPIPLLDRIMQFAEGYPKIAVLLGEIFYLDLEYRSQEEFILNDEYLMKKLIGGKQPNDSSWVNISENVLSGIALFEKVGYKNELSYESQFIAELVNVSWEDFQKVVSEQRNRGIIQGEYYIHVAPFALAIYLIKKWWEIHQDNFNINEFIEKLPEKNKSDFFDRFINRIPYFISTLAGTKLTSELLSENGLFSKIDTLNTKLGSNFFLKLAEADPANSLSCLIRIFNSLNKEQIVNFIDGRRNIIYALEKIVIWKQFFQEGAKILLKLAEAENENYSNNATGVFVNLFTPAPSITSMTEADLETRFEFLREAFSVGSKTSKEILLQAFKNALKTRDFYRISGAEYQGLKPLPKLWTPKNSQELLDYYQKIWEFLDKYLENYNSDEFREKVLSVLCEAAPEIANCNIDLSKMVFKTFTKLSQNNWIDIRYLLQAVVYILKIGKKKMNKETYSEWEKFYSKLLENNFSNKLKRFVGMNMIEDLLHDKDEYDKEWIELQIKNLASNATQNPELLLPEYEWLLTNETGRTFQFGYFLGLSDPKRILLDEIIRSYKSRSDIVNYQFLGGYLKSIHDNNFKLWEKVILNLSEDPYFASNFPQLVWYSGVSNNIIKKIIVMLSNELFGVEKLYSFKFGNIFDQINESLFRKLILLLLKEKSGLGAGLALDLCYNRYLHPKMSEKIPKNIFKKILLHQVFWENQTKIKHEGMTEFVWKETAKIVIKIFPELQLKIANKIMEFFADDNSITGGYHSQINEVLIVIIKEKPRETLKIIEKYIEPPYDSRAFHLTQWLRGGIFFDIQEPSVLEYFNFNDIWKWVEGNPEKRASYLASFVPPKLFPPNGQPSLTRELLIKYGHLKSVRNSFSSNYSTDGWTGSEVKHLQSKKNELIEIMKNEKSPNIQLWITEYIKYLDKDIERAKMFEEREGFFYNEE